MKIPVLGKIVLLSFTVFLFAGTAQAAEPKSATVVYVSSVGKNLKKISSAFVSGSLSLKDAKGNNYVEPIEWTNTLYTSQLVAIWKNAPTASKLEKLAASGSTFFKWKNAITLSKLNSVISTLYPVIKEEASTAQQKTFKPPYSKGSGIVYTALVDKSTGLPREVDVTWSVTLNKKKLNGKLILYFSSFESAPISVVAKSSSPVSVKPVKKADTSAAAHTSGQSQFGGGAGANQNTSGAPTGAIDAFGNGGIESAKVDNLYLKQGRDTQRVNDLKAIQTALELFFNDQGYYPNGSDLRLGGASRNCLNSDGWTGANDCPYPYMALVPLDPSGTSYVYNINGQGAYYINSELEGSVNNWHGLIRLTQNGIINR